MIVLDTSYISFFQYPEDGRSEKRKALFEHNPSVIEAAADRQMSHVRSYASGPHSIESQQMLNELSTAKLCLLDDKRKAEYDAGLRSRLAATPMGGAPLAQIPAPVFAVQPLESRKPARSESTTAPSAVSPVRQSSPPKSAIHTFVLGALGIVALVLVLMFLTHLAHFTITALKDERKEDSAPASFSLSAEPSPSTTTDSKPESQRSVAPAAPPSAIVPFNAAQAKQHQEAWAKHLGLQVIETNSVGMKLVLIPPGRFTMGTLGEGVADSEKPANEITLTRAFFLGDREITVEQFQQFIGELDPLEPSALDMVGLHYTAAGVSFP